MRRALAIAALLLSTSACATLVPGSSKTSFVRSEDGVVRIRAAANACWTVETYQNQGLTHLRGCGDREVPTQATLGVFTADVRKTDSGSGAIDVVVVSGDRALSHGTTAEPNGLVHLSA